METILGKRKGYRSIVLVLCLFTSIWGYSQRPVKEIRRENMRVVVAEKIIREGEKYVGLKELTGDNDHPQIQQWLKQCGLNGQYPWCAAFMTGIHNASEVPNPESARVVDWFKHNVTWKREFGEIPEYTPKTGMVGGLYYRSLGRYGHIFLIVGEDKNNFYTLEGNTNSGGSREGDGVYKKIRSKKSVAVMADYCLSGKQFISQYDKYLKSVLK